LIIFEIFGLMLQIKFYFFGRSPFLKKKGAGFSLQSSPIKIGEGFTLQSLTQHYHYKEDSNTLINILQNFL